MKANVQKKKITGNGFLLLITIALFVVMYVAGMIVFADKGFAKPQMFLNLFVSNAGLLVIACGLTIVMITGGIDISVGSVTALVCMVLADLMENKGVNAYAAVLVALLIGVAFGIVQGFLVAYLDIQPFIVTLAGMFFGRGLTAIISTDMISIKNELFLKWANYRFYMPFGSTSKKGKFIPAYIPPTVVIALIVVILIAVLLKYRKFGRKLYAIGGSRQSALMMGLNVKRTMFQAYVLDGFLAGLGGFLFYAFMYGALGALVSKIEDLNKSAGTAQMIVMIVYFVVLMNLTNVDGLVIRICSYLPISSYSAMFARVAMGDVATWEVVISAIILYISVIGMGVLGGKIFRNSTLRYGNPIRLSRALKELKREK